jgi:hypothetical protein
LAEIDVWTPGVLIKRRIGSQERFIAGGSEPNLKAEQQTKFARLRPPPVLVCSTRFSVVFSIPACVSRVNA